MILALANPFPSESYNEFDPLFALRTHHILAESKDLPGSFGFAFTESQMVLGIKKHGKDIILHRHLLLTGDDYQSMGIP